MNPLSVDSPGRDEPECTACRKAKPTRAERWVGFVFQCVGTVLILSILAAATVGCWWLIGVMVRP